MTAKQKNTFLLLLIFFFLSSQLATAAPIDHGGKDQNPTFSLEPQFIAPIPQPIVEIPQIQQPNTDNNNQGILPNSGPPSIPSATNQNTPQSGQTTAPDNSKTVNTDAITPSPVAQLPEHQSTISQPAPVEQHNQPSSPALSANTDASVKVQDTKQSVQIPSKSTSLPQYKKTTPTIPQNNTITISNVQPLYISPLQTTKAISVPPISLVPQSPVSLYLSSYKTQETNILLTIAALFALIGFWLINSFSLPFLYPMRRILKRFIIDHKPTVSTRSAVFSGNLYHYPVKFSVSSN